MQKQISERQAGLIMMVAVLANKLLMLPSLISFEAKNNAYLVFFATFLIDFLFIMLFLYLNDKIKMPIFEFLKQKFGKAVAIIIALPVILTFALKCVDIFGECYLFFDQVMYVQVDQIVFMACFVIMILYLGSRALRTLGRSIELLFFIFVTSLFLSLYLSIGSANWSNILPFFSITPNSLFSTMFAHNVWFGDFLVLFLLCGNIKMEKHTNRRILIDYVVADAIVLLTVVIFTCVFNSTAPMHKMAIINITEYTPRLTSEGRINWLIDLIFPLVCIIGLGIYANAGSKAVETCLPKKVSTNLIAITIFTGIVLALAIISNTSYPNLYQMLTKYGSYFSFATQYILPIILILLCQKKEKVYDKKVAI